MKKTVVLNQFTFLDKQYFRLQLVHKDLLFMKKSYGNLSLNNDIKEIKLLISLVKHYKINCDDGKEVSNLNLFIASSRLIRGF